MRNLRLSYYPWMTQHITPAELDKRVRRFAAVLQQQLSAMSGMPVAVDVLAPLDVPAQIVQLISGGADLALMNPLGYVFAHDRDPSVQSIAVAQRVIDGKVGTRYYAQIYTHKKTSITDIAQAKGRSVAFGVKFSTSNFLIPALELKMHGLHPLTAFSSVSYLGGHDKVAQAVYEARVDIGAGHHGVIADLSNQYGYSDAKECLVQLLRSAPIPSDPIVLRTSDTSWTAVLTKALVTTSQQPDGKDALGKSWGGAVGLEPISPSAYDTLSIALTTLSLSETDILG